MPGLPGDDEDDPGYRVPTALAAAGITYRQLDYWARTGLVEPSVRGARGSGSHREYSFRDVVVLKVVKKLLDTGVSLQNVRAAVGHLRSRGVDDLAQITLVSDGASVYECRSRDEVVDVLSGGQCVFAIAIGGVVPEVQGSLARLPEGGEQETPARGWRARGRRAPRRAVGAAAAPGHRLRLRSAGAGGLPAAHHVRRGGRRCAVRLDDGAVRQQRTGVVEDDHPVAQQGPPLLVVVDDHAGGVAVHRAGLGAARAVRAHEASSLRCQAASSTSSPCLSAPDAPP